jgi:predicted regulator of Ras-like GTPase activity (Roadblock/LC7/MglB family)
MAKEEYAEVLKNALIEIRNICPDINNSFIFTKEGAIIAGDSEVADTTVKTTLNSFQNIAEKAEMMGGISSFSVDGVQGRVYISHINDMYLATATSKKVDENYVRSVTQVIIPTILKLLESINPTPLKWGQGNHAPSIIFGGKPMVIELREYGSAVDISRAIDQEITSTKSQLGEHLRQLDEIRTLAERSKKIREVVLKLAGKTGEKNSLGEISVGDLNVVLDANPFHELTAIEEVVRSQQDKLLFLQKSREALKWLDQIGETEGIKYLVLEKDGVPERILLKVS